MKEYILDSWQDYWKIFDELIELLERDNLDNIVFELKNAQKYVNGLTDGWFEFKHAFENCLRLNRSKMTSDQTDVADFLIKTLNKTLKNR